MRHRRHLARSFPLPSFSPASGVGDDAGAGAGAGATAAAADVAVQVDPPVAPRQLSLTPQSNSAVYSSAAGFDLTHHPWRRWVHNNPVVVSVITLVIVGSFGSSLYWTTPWVWQIVRLFFKLEKGVDAPSSAISPANNSSNPTPEPFPDDDDFPIDDPVESTPSPLALPLLLGNGSSPIDPYDPNANRIKWWDATQFANWFGVGGIVLCIAIFYLLYTRLKRPPTMPAKYLPQKFLPHLMSFRPPQAIASSHELVLYLSHLSGRPEEAVRLRDRLLSFISELKVQAWAGVSDTHESLIRSLLIEARERLHIPIPPLNRIWPEVHDRTYDAVFAVLISVFRALIEARQIQPIMLPALAPDGSAESDSESSDESSSEHAPLRAGAGAAARRFRYLTVEVVNVRGRAVRPTRTAAGAGAGVASAAASRRLRADIRLEKGSLARIETLLEPVQRAVAELQRRLGGAAASDAAVAAPAVELAVPDLSVLLADLDALATLPAAPPRARRRSLVLAPDAAAGAGAGVADFGGGSSAVTPTAATTRRGSITADATGEIWRPSEKSRIFDAWYARMDAAIVNLKTVENKTFFQQLVELLQQEETVGDRNSADFKKTLGSEPALQPISMRTYLMQKLNQFRDKSKAILSKTSLG